jgi:hypothetical protein
MDYRLQFELSGYEHRGQQEVVLAPIDPYCSTFYLIPQDRGQTDHPPTFQATLSPDFPFLIVSWSLTGYNWIEDCVRRIMPGRSVTASRFKSDGVRGEARRMYIMHCTVVLYRDTLQDLDPCQVVD